MTGVQAYLRILESSCQDFTVYGEKEVAHRVSLKREQCKIIKLVILFAFCFIFLFCLYPTEFSPCSIQVSCTACPSSSWRLVEIQVLFTLYNNDFLKRERGSGGEGEERMNIWYLFA